ncbi:SURF1 family protein [Variovorax sp. J22R133]|uniref:SURF1 family protein n=1 Tax=Variovorax brevis TaxID=3053503 RepID=UPI0025790C53|nr:SURF1 family protein [Variovorax sp. J22R133]MDM0115067.1 SURF1 family protein [Variovorax sp. J22R133]
MAAVPLARRGHRWIYAVAAFALVATGVSLGRWQLDRAAQKEALQAEIEAQGKLPALDQAAFLALQKPTEALHRPVRLRGLWLAPQTVYLDNRQMHGVPGFYVLTPFALEGSNQTVMIQRGWVQRNFTDRTHLKPVETPTGLVEVQGVVATPPAHLLDLGKADAPMPAASAPDAPAATKTSALAAAGSSAIRQNLDLEAFRAETRLPLRTDVTLQETGAASQGLQRDWPAPALGVERHYGYAFQWFGLAALVAILYVWFQFIAPLRRAGRARNG